MGSRSGSCEASASARSTYRFSRLGVPDRKRDERQALPVEASLHGHRARSILTDELEQERAAALDVARLEPRDREAPARPTAAVRDRGSGQPRIDARALLVGGDRTVEVAGVVQRPAELEEGAVELVRAGGEPRGLERRLAELDRLAQPALHLEGEVLGEQQRAEQLALAERPRDRDARARRVRPPRRSARDTSRPTRGDRAPRGAAPARRPRAGRARRVHPGGTVPIEIREVESPTGGDGSRTLPPCAICGRSSIHARLPCSAPPTIPRSGANGSPPARSRAPSAATSGSSTGTAARSSGSRRIVRSRSCPARPSSS